MASSTAALNPPKLNITSPLLHSKYYITKDASWPSIVFETDAVLDSGEEMLWEWSIEWGRYCSQGVMLTATAWWDAQCYVTNWGGTLTVSASRGDGLTASMSVQIVGTQPDDSDVLAYMATLPDSSGFDKILMHESGMRHFNEAGQPVSSFDSGFGMAQLTNPMPDYGQVWNWKLNVDAGVTLYAQKRAAAVAYLSRKGSYSDVQLLRETVSRWNGGCYHCWDAQLGWIRRPGILCDSKTGNIGWNMTENANKGKTEAELHARDEAGYARPPKADDAWGYYGVCYADSVLGVS